MAGEEAVPGFDRRKSDVNVSALATRVAGLEERVELLEKGYTENTRELEANTRLTQQVHEVLHGRENDPGIATKVDALQFALKGDGTEDAPGVAGKVDRMYDVFAAAAGGFKVLEYAGKIAKPIGIIAAACAAVVTLVATGHWPRP